MKIETKFNIGDKVYVISPISLKMIMSEITSVKTETNMFGITLVNYSINHRIVIDNTQKDREVSEDEIALTKEELFTKIDTTL